MKSTGDKREMSTTMALVRMLANLETKMLPPRLVPIIADEARTFGMEGFQKVRYLCS